MLQRLPNQLAGTDANAQMWEHLEALATTLTLEELLNLDDQTILHRLFHDTPPQLPDAQALQFGCTCTRERNRNALLPSATRNCRPCWTKTARYPHL